MHDTVNMTLQILVILFCATQAAARGLRDGLIISRNAGWTSFHVLGWLTTDTLRIGLAIGVLIHNAAWLAASAILATGLLHQPCYTFALRNPEFFAGPQNPPAWFRTLQRLWSWFPGQRPVLYNIDAACDALRRNKPFILVCKPDNLPGTVRLIDALDESAGELISTHHRSHSVFTFRPFYAFEQYNVESDT